MQTRLPGLGRALAAGSALLVLAACDSTSNPTAPAEQAAAIKAAEAAAAALPASVTIRGSVVDSDNRLLANAAIECLGDVECTHPLADVVAEGHEHRIMTTEADGSYHLVATTRGGGGGFLMNANMRGFEVQWREVSWPRASCAADQPGCTITVNFKLSPLAELGEE